MQTSADLPVCILVICRGNVSFQCLPHQLFAVLYLPAVVTMDSHLRTRSSWA
uniref:Uncharacterized protein n=1 Tax=Neolamprologus brichardi TaxID=32507 RepID=A0A3Q4MFP8_NEOBR